MSGPVIEPIEPHRPNLGELLDDAGKIAGKHSGNHVSSLLLKRWKSTIDSGTGFVLLDGSDCVGLVLYSTEYELGFSSLLSPSSAQKLPRSATIFACHVLERARGQSESNEQLLLQSAVSRLRSVKSIETIAIQMSAFYRLDLKNMLAKLGFMSCRRVQMQRKLTRRIPRSSVPTGCTLETPTIRDADALRSVVYHGYFSEIDGYLFPDIAAVCSDGTLFEEFLSGSAIDQRASVVARVQDYACGCVIVLSEEGRRRGLIGVVTVVPNMRRRGIARAMLQHVIHSLQENRIGRAALAVTVENRPALSLYSSLGFEEVGPRTAISVWRRSVSRPLMTSVR
ncbi:MAG: GNAT family N-acetyltransferase [Candidatus Hydrogenedentota bacterium]|nr:MAG: GNAT family N-acetyltransferase [Candidatus Hydrogenedentota bacterium]